MNLSDRQDLNNVLILMLPISTLSTIFSILYTEPSPFRITHVVVFRYRADRDRTTQAENWQFGDHDDFEHQKHVKIK